MAPHDGFHSIFNLKNLFRNGVLNTAVFVININIKMHQSILKSILNINLQVLFQFFYQPSLCGVT